MNTPHHPTSLTDDTAPAPGSAMSVAPTILVAATATDNTAPVNTNQTRQGRPEARLAPHVDAKWSNDFIVALRLAEVAGQDIGAALTEVDDYVAASGQTAQQAFGDPTAYAYSLDLPRDPGQSTIATIKISLAAMALVAAFWLTGSVVIGWARHASSYIVPWGLLIFIGCFLILAWTAEPLGRFIAGRTPWKFIVGAIAGAVAAVLVISSRWGFLLPLSVILVATIVLWVGGLVWWFAAQGRAIESTARSTLLASPLDDNPAALQAQIKTERRNLFLTPAVIIGLCVLVNAVCVVLIRARG